MSSKMIGSLYLPVVCLYTGNFFPHLTFWMIIWVYLTNSLFWDLIPENFPLFFFLFWRGIFFFFGGLLISRFRIFWYLSCVFCILIQWLTHVIFKFNLIPFWSIGSWVWWVHRGGLCCIRATQAWDYGNSPFSYGPIHLQRIFWGPELTELVKLI